MNLASSGDTVLVSEGTYVDIEDCQTAATVVCVFQKELTILGGFAGGNWSLPDPATNTTVIDGQNVRRGVVVRRGGTNPGFPTTSLRLEGFTIRRGLATSSGNGLGGGLWANLASVELRDLIFEDNAAQAGSGALGGGGGVAILSNSDNVVSADFERIVFRNNQTTGGGGTGGHGQGGALLTSHAIVNGSHLEFTNNTATGGASATVGQDGLGGGAAFSFGSVVVLNNITATGNQALGPAASSNGGFAFGGAIYVEGEASPVANKTQVQISDSRLTHNLARGGNGSTAGGGVGGGISTFGAELTLDRTFLISNDVEGGVGSTNTGSAEGGGVAIWWPFSATPPPDVIRNCIFAENVIDGTAGGGGGLRILGADVTVSHSTFVDNRLVGIGFGLGILVGPFTAGIIQPGELTLAFSILADHTVNSNRHALHVQANMTASSTANLGNRSLFVGNSSHTNEGTVNSGTFNGFPGTNIFDADPSDFYVNPAGSNYHVDGTQPPTNAATGSAEPFDIDGASRSGLRDLGADEFGAMAFGLSVAKIGVGSGTVTSSPAGINCGSDCFQNFAKDTVVDLTPLAAMDASFTGWSGPADCSDGVVTMTQDLQCTAQFEGEGAAPMCSAEDDALVLTGQTVNNTRNEVACNSITAGPSYTVGASGTVTFEAPRIVIRDGFTVSGQFTAINGTP